MNDAIIITRHLIYRYQRDQRPVINDVSIEIKRGSCVAIVGSNGSGKSTLVQHFNGLLHPERGEVIVDGVKVGERGADLQALRWRVGMLFQFAETQLFEQTIFDDVAFGPRQMGLERREVRHRVRDALETVGLPSSTFAPRSPFELSGGQRRRVALAGILAMKPQVLILDEPTAGLDGTHREELYVYLRKIQQKREITIVIVSHDMSEVAALAEHVFVLHRGQLVMSGTPAHVFAQGEQLQPWGLAVPPLDELLTLLRARGITVPEQMSGLDDIVAYLSEQANISAERQERISK